MPFSVDPGLCRRDGICAAVCPARIITCVAGELPHMSAAAEKRCIRCGQCMAFCPTAACSAPDCDVREQLQLRPERFPGPEQVEELIFRRRSIRNFKAKPVPKELLERILNAARFAPSSHNTQPLRWLVTDSKDKVRQLAELTVGLLEQLPEKDPGVALRLHAAGLARAWHDGYDVIMRDAPHLVLALAPKAHGPLWMPPGLWPMSNWPPVPTEWEHAGPGILPSPPRTLWASPSAKPWG